MTFYMTSIPSLRETVYWVYISIYFAKDRTFCPLEREASTEKACFKTSQPTDGRWREAAKMKKQHFSHQQHYQCEKGQIRSFKVHRPKPSGHFGEGGKKITVSFTLLLNLVQPEQCCSDSIPWILQNICIKINQENMKSSMCAKGDLKETAATAKKNETKQNWRVLLQQQSNVKIKLLGGVCVCVHVCFLFLRIVKSFIHWEGPHGSEWRIAVSPASHPKRCTVAVWPWTYRSPRGCIVNLAALQRTEIRGYEYYILSVSALDMKQLMQTYCNLFQLHSFWLFNNKIKLKHDIILNHNTILMAL